jgi:hypothetical protein
LFPLNDRQDQDFNVILTESIRETIAQLLSPKVAENLFEHLEKVYSVKKDEIPSHLDTLLLTLTTYFGSSSSQVIGKAIARRFYSQLGLEFSDEPQRTLIGDDEKAKLTHQK